MKDWGFFQASF